MRKQTLRAGVYSIYFTYVRLSGLHVGGARHQEIVVVVELERAGFGSVYLAGVGCVGAGVDLIDKGSHDG